MSDRAGGRGRLVTAEDVSAAYRLFLGRPPESDGAIRDRLRSTRRQLIGDLMLSAEFRAAMDKIVSAKRFERGSFDGFASEEGRDLIATVIGRSAAARIATIRTWRALLAVVLSDPDFQRSFPELPADLCTPAFKDALEEWSGLDDGPEIIGGLEAVDERSVSGWVLDVRAVDKPVRVEIWVAGRFWVSALTDHFRRDLQDQFGGSGLYGFRAPLALGDMGKVFRSVQVDLRIAGARRPLACAEIVLDAQADLDALAAIHTELAALKTALARIEARLPEAAALTSFSIDNYDRYRAAYYGDTAEARRLGRARVATLDYRPRFSIVLPTTAADMAGLERAIGSVVVQDYPAWALIVVDRGAPDPHALAGLVDKRGAGADGSIRICESHQPSSAVEAFNRGLDEVDGDYVICLSDRDLLAPDALASLAAALQGPARPGLVYADGDTFTDQPGGGFDVRAPEFKPDFDPVLLSQFNYIGQVFAVERGLAVRVGALDTRYPHAAFHDWLLRLTEASGADGVRHLARILYHSGEAETPHAVADEQNAEVVDLAAAHVARTGAAQSATAHEDALGAPRPMAARLRPGALDGVTATVIIPTRDKPDLIQACVDSLDAVRDRNRTAYDLLIVDNGGVSPESQRLLDDLNRREGLTVRTDPRPFNWAALNNSAAAGLTSDVLIFLNDDTLVMTPDWCDELCAWALREGVGAVGARLLYGDGTIQHAGVVIGAGGFGAHEGVGDPGGAPGYLGRHTLARRSAAVTGACMATRRGVFEALGGFDATRFAVTYNDVDYCLRAAERGLHTVWTPHCTLYHLESKTRRFDNDPANFARALKEQAAFRERWGETLRDPYYNAHFERNARPFSRLTAPRSI